MIPAKKEEVSDMSFLFFIYPASRIFFRNSSTGSGLEK